MKHLHFDCSMGASGDMIVAALLDLVEDKKQALQELSKLSVLNVELMLGKSNKCGIVGNSFRVIVNGQEEGEHNHEHCHDHHHHEHKHEHCHDHHHNHEHKADDEYQEACCCGHSHQHSHGRGMDDIRYILTQVLDLKQSVVDNALSIYNLVALAESKCHNVPVTQIHFHELGQIDAIVDICSACILLDMISPDKISSSSINTGSGHVHCAHGIMPVPAPATLEILQDIPIYSNGIQSELCTPTGAAILKHFVQEYDDNIRLKPMAVGYGMGKKDFAQANCLRLILSKGDQEKSVYEISCNIDDMTGEELSYAMEQIMKSGALDVFITPIYMKKSRPAHLLSAIVRPDKKDLIIKAIFKHTTTLGVREILKQRTELDRLEQKLESNIGQVSIKKAFGDDIDKSKIEFEDLKALAEKYELSIFEIKKLLKNYE